VSLLHILVEQHSKEVQGKVRISWDTVSRLINRRYYDCQNKWNTIKKATLKVGAHFCTVNHRCHVAVSLSTSVLTVFSLASEVRRICLFQRFLGSLLCCLHVL
jgi:hypothetical protein